MLRARVYCPQVLMHVPWINNQGFCPEHVSYHLGFVKSDSCMHFRSACLQGRAVFAWIWVLYKRRHSCNVTLNASLCTSSKNAPERRR